MSDTAVLLCLALGALGFMCAVALFVGAILCVAAREDRELEREALERVRELEGAWALPAREPVR